MDHSLIGPDTEKRRPFGSLDRQDMIFLASAETKGSSMMSRAEVGYTSFVGFGFVATASRSRRWPCCRPSDWLAAARRSQGGVVRGPCRRVGNDARDAVGEAHHTAYSLQVSVWDKDSMSKDDFMERYLARSTWDPPVGRVTLPLKDNPKKNPQKLPVSG